jgi:regulatory protein
MAKPISEEETLSRLMQLCSRSEKCRQDIQNKINLWNYKGDGERIIKLLEKEKFINEERYCEAFVRDKIKFMGWGKIKIRFALTGKNIPNDLINNALASYPDEEYLQVIKKELSKKSKTLKETDKIKHKQKLLAFASQRGYEPNIIYNMVDNIIEML